MKTKLLSVALLAAAWLAGVTAQAHDGDHSYTNGICTIDGCTDMYQPAEKVDGVYLLSNVGNVEWMSAKVGAGETEPGDGGKPYAICSYKLTADIDYAGLPVNAHKPIGTFDKKFLGVFDGDGHSIKNMKLDQPTRPKPNDDGIGFFGCVRVGNDAIANVVIKNLTIDSSCEVKGSSAYVAGIVGRIHERTQNNTLLIENCVNKANITTSANHVAGIVGQITAINDRNVTITIKNCTNEGAITTSGAYAAGIVAQINSAAASTVNIFGCTNKGAVQTAGLCAAGIVSQANNCAVALNIESCMNFANITSTGNKNCGGIHGANYSSKATIRMINCGNTGNVSATTESAALTGWIGSNSGNVITNCWNNGSVTGVSNSDNTYRGTVTVTNVYDINGGQGTVFTNDDITSGKLCYLLNGDQNTINWYQNLTTGTVDAYPVPDGNGHAQVYQVADYYCDGTPKGSVVYSNTDGGSKDDHVFDTTTGLCTRCSYPKEDWLSADADGFYYLGTPEQVEWFSHMVRDAHHNAMNVKLTADIDFGGVADAHLPIGTNTQKYFGHFDGQGHRIKGMVLTTANNLKERANDGQGFFGSVRGGGVADGNTIDEVIIENLIIDASCSVTHDQNFVAGVVGRVQAVNSGSSVVIIRNCGNEANVTTSGKNAAGILGCVATTNVGLKLYNLWNKGKIVGNGGESAAICAWTGQRNVNGEVDVEGCWNIGEVTGIDGNHYNMIRRNTNIVPRNIVDLCIANGTKGGNQGVVSVLNTTDPISSGELCYLLNGDQSTIVYTQTLGTDEMPVYGTTSLQVYQAGTVNCLGAAVGGISYNNVSGETTTLPHNINTEIGMCDVCYTQFQEPEKDGDYYLLKNAGNVEWLSAKVATSGGAAFYAKMENDIDFLSRENLHSPIGPATNCKFKGIFDGQGYRIKNMIINRPSTPVQGFFGWLQGNDNTTIKNLIIDKSCSIIGSNKCGGVAGASQNASDWAVITIENVVNEADVTVSGQDAAGIVGGEQDGKATYYIHNVVNTGNITSTHKDPFAGALFCYQEKGKVENFLNLGTITGHLGGNIGRFNVTWTNVIDLSDTEDKTQGIDSGLTQEDLATGKVAYVLGFNQLIGSAEYPSPLNETEVFYVGDAGYATLFDANTGYELNGDVKAFVATTENTWLKLTEIENVPAETAVVLKGTYYNKLADNTLPAINIANDLKGTTAATAADGTMYILANGADGVGFYKAEGTIPAGKAYFQSTSGVKAFFFDGDDATGISLMEDGRSQMEDGAIYNIAGQRIQKMQKGINIINGKKVLF